MYMKPCAKCGKLFRAKRSKTRPEKRFCGRPCYGAAKAEPPVTLTCKNCGKEFQKGAGSLRQYRKKWGIDQRYCSIECSAVGRRADADATNKATCTQCGKEFSPPRTKSGLLSRRNRALCSTKCRSEFRGKAAAERFNRGDIRKHPKRNGYVWISIPALCSPTGKKIEMLEHRWVMQQHIGRPLRKEETVHHRNKVTHDNRLANLSLFSSAHGPGAYVPDIIQYIIEMCGLYRRFLTEAGYELREISNGAHKPKPPPQSESQLSLYPAPS